jgi:tetratricopeptide (TPR) repeat protein
VIPPREIFTLARQDPGKAAPLADEAVGRARRTGEDDALAWALLALAVVRRAQRRHSEADRLLAGALRLGRQLGDRELEAHGLLVRHNVRTEQGRDASARADLTAALTAASTAHADDAQARQELVARVTLASAVLDHNAGRLDSAERLYRRLVGGADDWIVANNLAIVVAERGAYAEASRHADQAVALAGGAPARLAPALQTRAWIATRAGRLAEGMRDFDDAARVNEEAGLPLGEYYAEYADAMADLRLLPEAEASARRAVEEFAAAGAALMGAEAQLRLAQVELLRGDAARARQDALAAADALGRQRRTARRDRALLVGLEARLHEGSVDDADVASARRAAARVERSGQLTAAVEAHLVAGRLALSRSMTTTARDELRRSAGLASGGSVLVRVRGRLADALEARTRGDAPATLKAASAGLRDLARHRSGLPTMELRALASGHGAELGELGLRAVIGGGRPADVLAWLERTRAAALTVRAADTRDEDGRDGEEHDHERAAPYAPVDATPAATRGVGHEGSDFPVSTSWSLAPVTVSALGALTRFPGMAALRRLLDGRALVEYARLDGRLVAVVVESRHSRVVELGAERDVVDHLGALFFALRRLATPRSDAAAAAARASADLRLGTLRRELVEPLGLAPDAEVVVVPVGPLHGVPWSAMFDGPVALAPSAAAWAHTAAEPRRDDGSVVLVAGPGLPGAREEIDALRGLHPGAVVIGPDESAALEVARAASRADLAHLACHGTLRADNPMFSSVLLADGPVTVKQLQRTAVAPRRLVLASCHAGADVHYAGNETLGFVTAMLAQGTAGIVASIAAIPDVEVVDLMHALHTALVRGETLAHALHGARAQIDSDAPGGFVNWTTFAAHGAA